MNQTMKGILWIVGAVVVVGGVYFIISEKNGDGGTVKIGAVLGLTGDGSFWGENARNGINLAVEDINAGGGINGKRMDVIFEDSKCDPKTAVSAVQKLIEIDRVNIIIGDICSSPTLAMAPIAESKEKVLITPCSESYKISEAGDYIFRTWTPNNRQAKTIAKHAFEKMGLRKVAVLRINNDFGNSLAGVFNEEFEKYGGIIVADEKYPQESRDLKTQLLKIKLVQPDGVYLSSYQPDGISAIKQMDQLGMNVKILATSGINSVDDFFKPLGSLADGIVFADLKDSTTPEFRERYSRLYNKEWPGMGSCASVAYDDVFLVAEGMKKIGYDATALKNFLYSVENFSGISGQITFDRNGDLDREHSIFVVKNGRPELVE